MPRTWNQLVAKAAYIVALAGPLSSVPQIYEIWSERNAAGVSFMTWTLFLVTSIVWLVYGISKGDRPLIISNALWIVGEIIIMVGAALYDNDWL